MDTNNMGRTSFKDVHIDDLLRPTIEAGCSELCLRVSRSPYTRSCVGKPPGELSEYQAPSPLDLMQMIYAIMTDEKIIYFERERELIFSYAFQNTVKFDVHIIHSEGAIEADFVVERSEF